VVFQRCGGERVEIPRGGAHNGGLMFPQRLSRGFALMALWGVFALSPWRAVHAAGPGDPVGAPASPISAAAVVPPVEEADPITSTAPAPASTPTLPGAAGSSTGSVEPAPALELGAVAPVKAEPRAPMLERWWFWSAVAAVGISAFVIVAASSTARPPQTELGNRVAF
jgi:hypothetical protein